MINIYINQNQYQQCLYFQYRSDTGMFAGDGDRWRPVTDNRHHCTPSRHTDFRQSLTKGLRGRGIRIRCQMVKIMHLIFSLRKQLWAEILHFDKVWAKVFGVQAIRIRGQIVAIMHLIFSLRKQFWVDMLIFDRFWPKCVVDQWFESYIYISKTCAAQKTSDQTLAIINIWLQRCFLSEKNECMISIIWHRIRAPRPRDPLVKLCRKLICRFKSDFLVKKWAAIFTIIARWEKYYRRSRGEIQENKDSLLLVVLCERIISIE